MDSSIITDILESYINGASRGFLVLEDYAQGLFHKLLIIEFVLLGLGMAMQRIDFNTQIISKVLAIGFVQFVLFRYVWLVDLLINSCISVGLSPTGNLSVSQFLDVSAFITLGFDKFWSLLGTEHSFTLTTILSFPVAKLLYLIAGIVMLIAFFTMGLQIFLSLIEFYIISSITIIFVPFLLIKQTSFLAIRSLNSLLAICFKLMVLAFISGLSYPVLEVLTPTGDMPSLKEALTLALGSVAVSLVMKGAPSIAIATLNGSSGLNTSSGIMQPIMRGVDVGVTMAKTAKGEAGRLTSAVTSPLVGSAAGAVMKAVSRGASYVKGNFGK
ncbi:MAG: type IV secretion system protein [Myxococcales bacterium]|nr:type IV secretion system protein [Myxococcales bacterium]